MRKKDMGEEWMKMENNEKCVMMSYYYRIMKIMRKNIDREEELHMYCEKLIL